MIVLCTGCRSGFGLLIAVHAAKAGHTVYAGLRDLSTKGDLVEAARGLDVRPVQLDVTDAAQRAAVVEAIVSEHGRIDALVNNAGVALGGFQEQVAEDELRHLFDVNVFAPWALTKLCLPHLRAQREGVVINITSMSGRQAMPGLGAYAGSKFALEGFSEALRHEMRPFGVRVVLVEPGPFETDIMGRNRTIAADAETTGGPYAVYMRRMEGLLDKMKDRMGDPREVADLVVRLLDDPSPRLRYPLGPGVSARLWARRVLPFEAVERILERVVGF
ncbi:MAG: SDR family NAD(P)-dependent oxidoreductase [Sandaracinaceae bacterium]|nr:SDR family NAD(P)-dependent oxidoreductase [Sandaracinaceae bacterium]